MSTPNVIVADDFNVVPVRVAGNQVADDFNVGAVPPQPPVVTLAVGDAALQVIWAPSAKPSAAVTGWLITATSMGVTLVYPTAIPSARQMSIGGLTNGFAWTVTVIATSLAGNSAPSASVQAISVPGAIISLPIVAPTTVPPAAQVLVSVTPAPQSLLVFWQTPAATLSPPTSFRVEATAPGSAPVTTTVAFPATSVAVNGLTNGTTYSVVVYAINGAGQSPASNALSAAPDPGAAQVLSLPVTGLTATALATGAALSWTVPTSLGTGTFVSYDISAATVSATLTYSLPSQFAAVALSQLFNNVAYTISVVVRTSLGVSPAATAVVTPLASAALPNASALAPLNVTAAPPPLVLPSPPPVLVRLQAFPSGKPFTPVNFGLLATDPRVVG